MSDADYGEKDKKEDLKVVLDKIKKLEAEL